MKNRGFTLIELILVIAILGILAVAALPKLFDKTFGAARTSAMNATAGAIQTGITLYAADQLNLNGAIAYPATLDSAAVGTVASNATPLFTNVLQNGVSAQWTKLTASKYAYDNDASGSATTGDVCFTYDSTAGTFLFSGTHALGTCP